jgi:hypothetical protein
MSDKPISDLRRRMLEDMAVHQFGEKTKHEHVAHVVDRRARLSQSAATDVGRPPTSWLLFRVIRSLDLAWRSLRTGLAHHFCRMELAWLFRARLLRG